ncbi:MAG TPA: hypothetical protein VE420_01820, partial [Gemmatimonadales bacterium]|nr:hypothetical protein [Gemmatimonadales bacterium]
AIEHVRDHGRVTPHLASAAACTTWHSRISGLAKSIKWRAGMCGASTSHEPTKRVPTSLRELQLSPPLFQQTPRFQALDGKPIHLSLEKLTFGHVLQSEPQTD